MDLVNSLMHGWIPNNHEKYWDEFSDEVSKRISQILKLRWFLDFNDRGMGHGNYGVCVKFNHRHNLIFGCEKEIGEHVVNLHNSTLPEDAVEPNLKVKCIGLWELDEEDEEYEEIKIGGIYEVVGLIDGGYYQILVDDKEIMYPVNKFVGLEA